MFRRRIPAPLLCLVLFCGSPAGVPWAQVGPPVASITFAGRAHVPEEALRKAVVLRPGEPFTPQQLETDRKALLALGYFRSVGAGQRTADGKTDVTFRLVEFPRVAHLRVVGNTVVDLRSIQEVVTTRVGQVLCAPQLQEDIRAIERLYRDRGYVARVSEKLLDEATKFGILRLQILELAIEQVEVDGGTPELQQRARQALRELPPRLYRPEAVTADQRRLLQIRGITGAQPHVELNGPGKVRIRWQLNPPPGMTEPEPPR